METESSIIIPLNSTLLHALDITPLSQRIDPLLKEKKISHYEQSFRFQIDYPQAPTDPRELSEIPEVRLWFLRVDTIYPWLPFLLDWKTGELARYTAMLVPHQFNRSEGIQYNPEALEIYLMQKIFILADWFRQLQISSSLRLKSMAQLLGYDLDDNFLEFLANSTHLNPNL